MIMSNFTRFMKKNKIQKENTTYAATKSLTDEKGNPLLWTIKPLTTKENESIRDDCMIDVQTQTEHFQVPCKDALCLHC